MAPTSDMRKTVPVCRSPSQPRRQSILDLQGENQGSRVVPVGVGSPEEGDVVNAFPIIPIRSNFPMEPTMTRRPSHRPLQVLLLMGVVAAVVRFHCDTALFSTPLRLSFSKRLLKQETLALRKDLKQAHKEVEKLEQRRKKYETAKTEEKKRRALEKMNKTKTKLGRMCDNIGAVVSRLRNTYGNPEDALLRLKKREKKHMEKWLNKLNKELALAEGLTSKFQSGSSDDDDS